jgi:hypothetical protein
MWKTVIFDDGMCELCRYIKSVSCNIYLLRSYQVIFSCVNNAVEIMLIAYYMIE